MQKRRDDLLLVEPALLGKRKRVDAVELIVLPALDQVLYGGYGCGVRGLAKHFEQRLCFSHEPRNPDVLTIDRLPIRAKPSRFALKIRFPCRSAFVRPYTRGRH